MLWKYFEKYDLYDSNITNSNPQTYYIWIAFPYGQSQATAQLIRLALFPRQAAYRPDDLELILKISDCLSDI